MIPPEERPSKDKEIWIWRNQGIKKEVRENPEKVIKHNSIKLAYNIKNILIEEGLLRTRKMTIASTSHTS